MYWGSNSCFLFAVEYITGGQKPKDDKIMNAKSDEALKEKTWQMEFKKNKVRNIEFQVVSNGLHQFKWKVKT